MHGAIVDGCRIKPPWKESRRPIKLGSRPLTLEYKKIIIQRWVNFELYNLQYTTTCLLILIRAIQTQKRRSLPRNLN